MRARDVMTREIVTVTPQTTVAAAVCSMHETGHGALPMVDAQGRLLGMLTDVGVLSRCLPEYVKEVGDLYTTDEFAPFEERVQALSGTGIEGLAQTDAPTAAPDTPVSEIAALMITHGVRHVAVVEDDRLVGIVGVRDVISSIARCAAGREEAP